MPILHGHGTDHLNEAYRPLVVHEPQFEKLCCKVWIKKQHSTSASAWGKRGTSCTANHNRNHFNSKLWTTVDSILSARHGKLCLTRLLCGGNVRQHCMKWSDLKGEACQSTSASFCHL